MKNLNEIMDGCRATREMVYDLETYGTPEYEYLTGVDPRDVGMTESLVELATRLGGPVPINIIHDEMEVDLGSMVVTGRTSCAKPNWDDDDDDDAPEPNAVARDPISKAGPNGLARGGVDPRMGAW